jgi:hypothetical protein
LFGDYAIKKNSSSSIMFDTLIEKDFFSKDINIIEMKNNIEINFIDIFNSLSVLEDKIYNSIKSEISNLEEYLEIIKVALDEKSFEHYIPVFSYNETYSNSLSYMLLNP